MQHVAHNLQPPICPNRMAVQGHLRKLLMLFSHPMAPAPGPCNFRYQCRSKLTLHKTCGGSRPISHPMGPAPGAGAG